jgi:LmbE family N-acetylglucosaminyl deacetylase
MKKLLIIAAHPDDDILGCGGVMSKYSKQGTEIKVVFIAEGTTCRFNLSDRESANVKREIEYRNNCAKKALAIFNIKNIKFYNLPCGRLDTIPIIEIGKIIENEIKSYEPDTIFTHSNIDVNNDHLTVFQASLQATRPNVLNFVQRVYLYEVLSSSEWRFENTFKPDIFISLDESNVNDKINALNMYNSEIKRFPFPRSSEGIKTLAKFRGMQAGCLFAESFVILREIIK